MLDAGSLDNKYVIRSKSFKNESTAGADASVEVPKLHNIKLLIASFYTHIDYDCMQSQETQIVGNDRP